MKRNHIFILIPIFISIGIFVSFNFISHQNNKPVLKVLTYSSFSGVYGPGRKLQKEFEAICNCLIHWVLAEDSTGMLQRIHFKIPIDVILGFDQITFNEFKNIQWMSLNLKSPILIPEVHSYKTNYVVPIDWSPIGFIYKNSKIKLSKNIQTDLFIPEKISLPEPRTSTLGLQFYYWIYSTLGGDISLIKSFLQKLKEKIYGPIFSWSLSYGIFQKDHVDMSLSYLTSLAYHAQDSKLYHFAYSQKGHPYQVELAGVPKNCTECNLALAFLDFLITKKAQKIIMESHFMFPVIKMSKDTTFSSLKIPKLISYEKLDLFLKQKEKLLEIWKENLY